MKRTSLDLSPERSFITSMIVSDRFLTEILPLFRTYYLKAGYAQIVAGWVVEYHGQFKKAPGKDIQSIWEQKRKSLRDEDEAENVAEFLGHISKEYAKNELHNVEYAIQNGIKYLKLRSQEVLIEQLSSAVSSGDPAKGEHVLAEYKRPERVAGSGVSILRDTGKVISAFMNDEVPLFTFPGALGEVIGPIRRGEFMSFLAPMKRGKTFLMWEAAEVAAHAGCKVLFVTLEMLEEDLIIRGWQSLTGRPKRDREVEEPYFEFNEVENKFMVRKKKLDKKGVNLQKVAEEQRLLRKRLRGGDIRIQQYSPYGATVADIEAYMDTLEFYEGYAPDVLVVDYADIIAPAAHFRGDVRHALDDTWKKLRKLSVDRRIALITASQADRSTFKGDAEETNVAEDIRKLAHVTKMIALNRTKAEEEHGVMRVSAVAMRASKRAFRQAVVLQCLDAGRAVVDSRLDNEVILDFEDDGTPAEEEERERRPGKKPGRRR